MMDAICLSPEYIWDEDAQQFSVTRHECALLLGVDVAHAETPQATYVAVMVCGDDEWARVVPLSEMDSVVQQAALWHAVTLLRNQHPDKPDAVQAEVVNIRQTVRNAIAAFEIGASPCKTH